MSGLFFETKLHHFLTPSQGFGNICQMQILPQDGSLFFRAVWWDRFSDNSRQIHVSVCSLIVRYWLTDRHHLLPGILEVLHTLKGLPHFVRLNGHKPQGAFSLVKESLEGCPSTDKNEIHHIPVTWSEIHSPAQTAQETLLQAHEHQHCLWKRFSPGEKVLVSASTLGHNYSPGVGVHFMTTWQMAD